MKKYKLINLETQEEHLCDKVTLDGFDYYVSDEKPKIGGWVIEYKNGDSMGELHFINGDYVLAPDIQKKVIATTSQILTIPKIVDEVERLAHLNGCPESSQFFDYKEGFIEGYNEAKETYQFTEVDVCEFVEWINLHYRALEHTISAKGVNGTKELLALWKEQQPITLYFK